MVYEKVRGYEAMRVILPEDRSDAVLPLAGGAVVPVLLTGVTGGVRLDNTSWRTWGGQNSHNLPDTSYLSLK